MKKVLKKLVPISLVLGFLQNMHTWHYNKGAAASEIAWLADASPGGFLNQNISIIIRGIVGTGIGWLILIFIVVYIFTGLKKYFEKKTIENDNLVNKSKSIVVRLIPSFKKMFNYSLLFFLLVLVIYFTFDEPLKKTTRKF